MNLSVKHVLGVSVGLLLCLSARADWYVATEANGGNDNNAGTADAPFLTIAKGVAAATAEVTAAGEGVSVVHVGEGEFPLTEQLVVSAAVEVRGAGRGKTFIKGKQNITGTYSGYSAVVLNHEQALLQDLMVYKNTYTVAQNAYGLGVRLVNGTLRFCDIGSNTASGGPYRVHGGGVYMEAGLIDHCVITNNVLSGGGGHDGAGLEILGGRVENTLIADNSATTFTGGGVYATGGTLVNCTIAGNKAGSGAGVYVNKNSPKFINCLIGDNPKYSAKDGASADFGSYASYKKANVIHCAIPGFEGGDAVATGPTDVMALNEPGNYTVMASSSAIDAGDDEQEYVTATDLAGNPRKIGDHVDAGCYEYDTSLYAASFDADKTVVDVGETLTLTPTVRGASGSLTYAWHIANATGASYDSTDRVVTMAFDRCGWYDVTLTVTDSVKGETVWTRSKYIYVIHTTRYVAMTEDGGSDANDGQTPDKPMATIEKAVAEAIEASGYAGEPASVIIGPGEFTVVEQVLLNVPIIVRGAGADQTFVAATANLPAKVTNVHATFVLQHDDAALENLTVWKGSYSNYDSLGIGVYMTKGSVRNCTVCRNTGNSWRIYGVGIYMTGGLVDHCVISNNANKTGARYGGGIAMTGGKVENSLIVGNDLNKGTDSYVGAGVWMSGGTLVNCTVAGNKTGRSGAGVYVNGNSPQIINCLIGDNLNNLANPPVASDVAYYTGYNTDLIDHCAIPNFEGGMETKTGAVDLKADYTVAASSSAIDAGRDDYDYASEGDLAGNDRKIGEHVDAGCYEYDTSGYAASFTVDKETFLCGDEVTLTPTVIGASDETKLSFAWTLTSDTGVVSNYTDRIVTTAFDIGGHYTVELVVTDPRKGETSSTKENLLYVVSMTRYVATEENGGSDDNHGQSPDKPFLSINKAVQEAADAALNMKADATVRIGEGTFPFTSSMNLSQPVHVLGAGRGKTFLTPPSDYISYRCFYLNNAAAEVADLTIRDFIGNATAEYNGLGVYIDTNGGFVHDCDFVNIKGSTGSAPHLKGPAAYLKAGRLLRCSVSRCASYKNLHNGGGIYMTGGVAESCLIFNNAQEGDTSNNSACGGGVYMAGGTLLNCTVSGNRSDNLGGGLYASGDSTRIVNCIIAGNTAVKGGNDVFLADTFNPANVVNSYCGGENLGTDPVLKDVDFVAGGYTLRASSACIDGGASGEELADTDLAGNPRINGSAVDLGCYEYDQSVFSCGFKADHLPVFKSAQLTLTPTVFSPPAGASLSYAWTVDNGMGTVSNYVGQTVTTAFDVPGYYTITLTVTDSVSGQSRTETRENYLYIVTLERYVATEEDGGSDGNPGTEESPFLTVEKGLEAINEVAGGAGGMLATLHIGPGEFPTAKTLSLAANVLVQGAGRDRTVLVPVVDPAVKIGHACFSLNVASSTVADLCVSNFVLASKSDGTMDYDSKGVGIRIGSLGGTVRDCRICDCRSGTYRASGTGIYMLNGKVLRTIVEDCLSTRSARYGGGIYMEGGLVESCLIRGNRMPKFANDEASGAGVYLSGNAKLVNSTVVGNDSFQRGGGVYVYGTGPTVVNCIITDNKSDEGCNEGAPDIAFSSAAAQACFENCLIGGNAEFDTTGDGALDPASAAIDASTAVAFESETDVYGRPRTSGSAADLGCCEFQQTGVSCGITADRTETLVGGEVQLTAKVLGASAESVSWTLTGDDNGVSEQKSGNPATFVLPKTGRYSVTMTTTAGGEQMSKTRAAWLYAGPETIYVATTEQDGALTNVQEAVDAAVDGTTIILLDGVHQVAGDLVLDKEVTLKGENGREAAVLKGTGDRSRVLTVAGGATVQGLTITGGRLGAASLQTDFGGLFGSGVWICREGGVVEDCVISNNVVSGNTMVGAGVAITTPNGRLTRSLVCANGETGQGKANGAVYVQQGGLVDDCLVVSNSTSAGAAISVGSSGTVANCTVVGNSRSSGGAGLYYHAEGSAVVENCVFAGNLSGSEPGSFGGYPEWNARLERNTSGAITANAYPSLTNGVKNCVFVQCVPVGEGSFTCEDAKFVDAAAGDYRITLGSPLRFKGLYEDWMREAADFWGNPRTVGRKRVDIGAFQTQGNGLMLMVR